MLLFYLLTFVYILIKVCGQNVEINEYISIKNFDTEKKAYNYFKKIGKEVITSLEEDDDLTAFETLGYDVDSDFETNEITINGDYKSYFEATFGKKRDELYFSYSDAGINEERLFKNVKRITGDLNLSFSKIFELDKDLEVEGTIVGVRSADVSKLFKNFISYKEIAGIYNLLVHVVEKLCLDHNFTPLLRMRDGENFIRLEGKNKEFLDNISKRKDEILTFDELKKKYRI